MLFWFLLPVATKRINDDRCTNLLLYGPDSFFGNRVQVQATISPLLQFVGTKKSPMNDRRDQIHTGWTKGKGRPREPETKPTKATANYATDL